MRQPEPQRLGLPVAGRWPLREGAVVVITGGLGGMGLEIALRLAQRYACSAAADWAERAAAAGRAWDAWLAARPAGERNAAAIRGIRAIEAAGGEVLVAAADASDEDAMRRAARAARERWGESMDCCTARAFRAQVAFRSNDRKGSRPRLRTKVDGLRVLCDCSPKTSCLSCLS